MLLYLIAQLIGFLALVVIIYHFQRNDRSEMMHLKLMSFLLFTAHFSMLGAWTGAVMNIIGGVRTYIFNFRTSRKWADKTLWPIAFIIMFWVFGILTWVNNYSIFPMIGMTTGTMAYWCKQTKNIRLLVMISLPPWFIYNLAIGSYPGMIGNIFIFSSLIISLLRFDVFKKKELKHPFS